MIDADTDAARDSSLFVQSVEKAVGVLSVFTGEQPALSLSEIARKSGLDMSAAQRFVYTLRVIGLITRDDPPVWLGASDRHDALENKGDTNHTPKHSEAVKKQCDEIGVQCVLKIGNKPSDGEQSPVEFLLKRVRQGSK